MNIVPYLNPWLASFNFYEPKYYVSNWSYTQFSIVCVYHCKSAHLAARLNHGGTGAYYSTDTAGQENHV